ncbi:hypothetical protein N8I77_010955 [Diaporthe amygdali]|uniref:Oxidase ustYa n=1 Tax=Phomopsis amygdali TaxID=1214568 RepID=A0AAD9S8G0_PHOAM|nr:hypothetical protein N8I77_010955 [Diaporthe amygdali]
MEPSYDYATLKNVSLQDDEGKRSDSLDLARDDFADDLVARNSRLHILQPKKARLNSCGLWIFVLFFLLSVLLGLLLGREAALRHEQYAGDRNHLTPEFSRKWVVFRPDRAYVPYNSSDYQASEFGGAHFDDSSFNLDEALVLWDRLQRDATIPISRPDQYDLPEPIIKHGKSAYIISAFHQLHCLGLIFEGFQRLHQHEEIKGDIGHYSHCFDFLRQAIMCAGDTTLEGVQHSENPLIKNTQGADGWGATHNCRNWDDIKTWAKERSI